MASVQIPFTSRHKHTTLYTISGKTIFGLWNPPKIKMDGDEKIVSVSSDIVGNLDILSFREYGSPEYWWCIALVNNIKDPTTEIVVNKELNIPKIANIRSALLDI